MHKRDARDAQTASGGNSEQAPRGTLYGVSVGPGDPELLTLKAVRIIQGAHVVAIPNSGNGGSAAYAIAKEFLGSKELLHCHVPMSRDPSRAQDAYRKIASSICELLDEGKSVAYLCLGDIGIYSSYMHVHDLVRQRGHNTCIVPGVTSFCASAASLGISLCEGQEQLVVAPATSTQLDDLLDLPGTKVLMKPGKDLCKLRQTLSEHGKLDCASMVKDCGLPSQRVYASLADAPMETGYFTTVIIRDGDRA